MTSFMNSPLGSKSSFFPHKIKSIDCQAPFCLDFIWKIEMKISNKEQWCQLVTEQEQLKQQQQYWESRFLGVGCVVEVVVGDCSPNQFDEGDVNNRILRNLFYLWILQSLIKCPQVRLFLAVHNSSIGDLVPCSVCLSVTTNNQSLHNTTEWP